MIPEISHDRYMCTCIMKLNMVVENFDFACACDTSHFFGDCPVEHVIVSNSAQGYTDLICMALIFVAGRREANDCVCAPKKLLAAGGVVLKPLRCNAYPPEKENIFLCITINYL